MTKAFPTRAVLQREHGSRWRYDRETAQWRSDDGQTAQWNAHIAPRYDGDDDSFVSILHVYNSQGCEVGRHGKGWAWPGWCRSGRKQKNA